MIATGTDVDPDPNTEEAGTNIKTRKVREIHIIIIQISQNNNDSSRIYTTNNLLSRSHT